MSKIKDFLMEIKKTSSCVVKKLSPNKSQHKVSPKKTTSIHKKEYAIVTSHERHVSFANQLAALNIDNIPESYLKNFIITNGAEFVINGRVYFCKDFFKKLTDYFADTEECLRCIASLLPDKVVIISPGIGEIYEATSMFDINCTGFTNGIVSKIERVGLKTIDGQIIFQALVEL